MKSKITSSIVALIVAFFAMSSGATAFAQVNLVLDTGIGSALPSQVNPGVDTVVVSFANPVVTFNGVTIRFVNFESVDPLITNPQAGGNTSVGGSAKFFVSGDLNLAAGQRIYGVGPFLAKLEVGNNATFADGSLISVSANGQQAGPGGGAGGAPRPSVFGSAILNPVFQTLTLAGGAGGLNSGSSNPNGIGGQSPGQLGFSPANAPVGSVISPGTNDYVSLFRSIAGGAGSVGQGNAAVSAGGVERTYRRPDGSLDPSNPDRGVADFELPATGTGGGGGLAGSGSIGNTRIAQPGGNGTGGGHGNAGLNAANAAAIQSLANPTTISLRGGNGGGAGATGGDGLPGAAGGGGGGGGSFNNGLGVISRGGDGGAGGLPALGGLGGLGGAGGAGGGGIQILVRGQLNVGTGAVLEAVGGNGAAGAQGSNIAPFGQSTQGQAGASGGSAQSGGGKDGGRGGDGGNGGRGGNGGFGVGGTGGTIQIAASNLNFAGTTLTQGGLAGDLVTRSANGATFLHGYSGASSNLSTPAYFGARAAGGNPYRSVSNNIAFDGGAPPGLVPNLPSIEGGAAPYGLLTGETSTNGAPPLPVAQGVKVFAELNAPPPTAGHIRVGSVTRVNAEFLSIGFGINSLRNNNQDVLLFSAFENDLRRPALSVVDPGHSQIFGDVVPDGPIRLRAGNGYLNDPSVTPGAVAPTDMAALQANKTFAMHVSGTQNVSASFRPYAADRTFTGAPTPSGTFGVPGANTVFLEDRGNAFIGFSAVSSDGRSRAGFDQEIETSGEYSNLGNSTLNLRAGTTGTANATVYGAGNTGTTVAGDVQIRTLKPQLSATEPGPFFTQLTTSYSQIAVDQSWNSNSAQIVTNGLAIGSTNRVGEVIFNPDYDDTTRSIVFPISGRIFGPSPQLQGAGVSDTTISIPLTELGGNTFATFQLKNEDVLSSISNVWRNAINQSPGLISLSILDYELIDPAGVFSVSGLGSNPFTLLGNQSRMFNIGFNPSEAGSYSATLRLLTDRNAPVGMAGDFLPISISAVAAVPEPASLFYVCGALALWMRIRRRSANRGVLATKTLPMKSER